MALRGLLHVRMTKPDFLGNIAVLCARHAKCGSKMQRKLSATDYGICSMLQVYYALCSSCVHFCSRNKVLMHFKNSQKYDKMLINTGLKKLTFSTKNGVLPGPRHLKMSSHDTQTTLMMRLTSCMC